MLQRVIPAGVCRASVALSLIALWQVAAASAQTIDVRALDKTMKAPGDSDFTTISDTSVDLKPRRSIAVRIVDTNPLLLVYSATVTKEETEQHKTAAAFMEQFGGFLTALGYKAPSTSGAGGVAAMDPKTLLVEGLSFADFHKRLTDLNTRLASLGAKLTQSVGTTASVEQLRSEVGAWNASKDLAALQTDYANIAKIATKCLIGAPLLTNQGTLRCSESVPLPVPPTVATPSVTPTNTTPTNTTPTSTTPNNPPRPAAIATGQAGTVVPPPPPTMNNDAALTAPSVGTIHSFVTLAVALRTQILDSAKVVSGFAADVAKLHEPVELAKVSYLPNEDQKIEVKIAASDVYKSFLDDATKERRDGAVKTFTVTASPYALAGWSLGAAIVAPIIDNPTFTAEKSGDKFVIRGKQGDSQPYQIAAMLTIEPRRWREQIFGLGGQVGVSPAKERIALYLGPHIRLYAVTIGGGLLLQRTSQLERGLEVDQEIASESALKLDTRLRPGGYVTASVTLYKK